MHTLNTKKSLLFLLVLGAAHAASTSDMDTPENRIANLKTKLESLRKQHEDNKVELNKILKGSATQGKPEKKQEEMTQNTYLHNFDDLQERWANQQLQKAKEKWGKMTADEQEQVKKKVDGAIQEMRAMKTKIAQEDWGEDPERAQVRLSYNFMQLEDSMIKDEELHSLPMYDEYFGLRHDVAHFVSQRRDQQLQKKWDGLPSETREYLKKRVDEATEKLSAMKAKIEKGGLKAEDLNQLHDDLNMVEESVGSGGKNIYPYREIPGLYDEFFKVRRDVLYLLPPGKIEQVMPLIDLKSQDSDSDPRPRLPSSLNESHNSD